MRLKTAHRERPAVEPDKPRLLLDTQIVEADPSREELLPAEPAVAVVSADQFQEPDEATLALQKQLAHLRASEQAQREYATAQMAAPAPTLPAGHADRIALWKQHGLSDDDAAFLSEHPDMIDNPALTRLAYGFTLQAGIERNSPDFAAAMEGNFASLLNRAQAQPATDPAGFFKPAPSPAPAPASPSALYSAPVSRQAPSAGYREPSPRSVKLTAEEQQIAAASGISDVQYAQNKLKMLRERASGQRE